MAQKLVRLSFLVAALVMAAFVSACGTIATPEWAAEVQETQAALVATADHLTEIAPTATPLPPTNTPTPVPATPTQLPPTATPTPAPPTTAPTVAAPPTALPPAEGASGDAENGMVVFQTSHTLPDGSAWACASCHSVTADQLRLIGPGLWNVSVRALDYGVSDSAEDYIHSSIINPQEFIAPVGEGEPAWALNMPEGWGDVLSEQELNDVIAYVMTLHD
jgi:mono/diheme cytochrome c family protein